MTDPSPESIVLRRVLQRLGWQRTGGFRNALDYWEARTHSHEMSALRDTRLVFPLIPDAPDYEDLLTDLEQRLRILHGDDLARAIDLVRVMISRRLDEVDVKRETDNEAGLIAWQSGNQMIDSARGLLSTAAKTASGPRKRFAHASSTIADEYLRHCYMGQTRVGSYVVTALTPSEESFATSKSASAKSKKHPRIPGRQITATLVGALGAVSAAIEESRGAKDALQAFDEKIGSGVSYELLAALEPITTGDESAIVVEFNENDQLALAEMPVHRAEFAFTPEDGKVIARARQHFEQAPEPRLLTVSGEVTLLRSSQADAERQIRLHTRIDGRPRSILVNLSDEQYDQAVRAHGAKVMLSVTGEVEQRTRGSAIDRAEAVRVETTPVSAEVKSEARAPLFDMGE